MKPFYVFDVDEYRFWGKTFASYEEAITEIHRVELRPTDFFVVFKKVGEVKAKEVSL